LKSPKSNFYLVLKLSANKNAFEFHPSKLTNIGTTHKFHPLKLTKIGTAHKFHPLKLTNIGTAHTHSHTISNFDGFLSLC
jgi:hypothetical protein